MAAPDDSQLLWTAAGFTSSPSAPSVARIQGQRRLEIGVLPRYLFVYAYICTLMHILDAELLMHILDAVIFMHILHTVIFMHILDGVNFMHILEVAIFMHILDAVIFMHIFDAVIFINI